MDLRAPYAPSKQKALKVTQPISPQFASERRLRERQERKMLQTVTDSDSKITKPKRVSRTRRNPTTSKAPIQDELKLTEAKPFSSSFEARQKQMIEKKAEKIKQELELANKINPFHANPVPKFKKLPEKKAIEVTQAEPFRLRSDERGAAYQEAFKRKLEEENHQLKEQALFFAQPAEVINKAPFIPERSSKIVEGPLDIQLATERRAAQRQQFDEQLREKEREEEEHKRQQEEWEELQRLEDIKRRRQMVHKAQPFKEPKPFFPKSSSKTLTVPQSPAFNPLPSKRRVMSRNN